MVMRCLLFMWLFTGCTPFLCCTEPSRFHRVKLKFRWLGCLRPTPESGRICFLRLPCSGRALGFMTISILVPESFPGGLGADVRYRFWNGGRLHLAMTPGFDAAYDAESTTLITDFRAPLTLEWAPGHNLSFIMDTRVVLREFWMVGSFPGGPGQFNRLEAFLGGGARFEWHPKRFRLGLGIKLSISPSMQGASRCLEDSISASALVVRRAHQRSRGRSGPGIKTTSRNGVWLLYRLR